MRTTTVAPAALRPVFASRYRKAGSAMARTVRTMRPRAQTAYAAVRTRKAVVHASGRRVRLAAAGVVAMLEVGLRSRDPEPTAAVERCLDVNLPERPGREDDPSRRGDQSSRPGNDPAQRVDRGRPARDARDAVPAADEHQTDAAEDDGHAGPERDGETEPIERRSGSDRAEEE